MARRAARATAELTDAEKIMRHVDERIQHTDTGRRADLLLSLPAALSAVCPIALTALGIAVIIQSLAMFALALPVLYKIIRHF
jgi:hypothetical protein